MSEMQQHVFRYVRGRVARKEIGDGTIPSQEHALNTFAKLFGDRHMNQLTIAFAERWLEQRAYLRPSTLRREQSTVCKFCDWLVRDGHAKTNPFRDLPPVRQPRSVVHTLDRTEVNLVLSACSTERDVAIVMLMFVLGLRCVEVSRLNVDDWDRRSGLLRIVGKFENERHMPTTKEVDRALAAHLRSYRQHAMFPSNWGGHDRITPRTISVLVSTRMRDAGVKSRGWDGKSAHAFRRTAVTEVLDVSGDVRAAQEFAGHAHVSSLDPYIKRANAQRLRAAVEGRFADDAA